MAAHDASQPTIVLVHGAWHSAFHWRPLIDSLTRLGRRALAIDLPGHGPGVQLGADDFGRDPEAFAREVSYAAGIDTKQAAQAIIAALRGLPPGARPLVMAHSMNGGAATLAAETAPDLFGRLVYLAAFAPVARKSPAAYSRLPEFQTGYGGDLFFGDPAQTGAIRIDPRGDDAYLERLRLAYYQDVPFEDFLVFARALTPDLPLRLFMDEIEVTPERWGRVPRTYIRCTLDRALAPAVQTMMIEEADRLVPGNPTHVIDLPTSHSPFASDPHGLARILDTFTVGNESES